MQYRVTLDGTDVTGKVEGLKELTLEIVRDDIFHGLFVYCTSTLTFTRSAYTQIYEKWETTACGELTCLIEAKCPDGTFATVFDGLIFTNDVEFDLRRCVCNTTLKDNSFEARIRNNRRIKAHVKSDLSKNEVTITPAQAYLCSYFNTTTGAYSFTGRGTYRVGDVFRYLVDFMTDGEMGFYSNLFSDGYHPEWEYLTIVQGVSISQQVGDVLEAELFVDFDTLFSNIDKIIPIAATVEEIAGQQVIRIEERSFVFDETIDAGTHRRIGDFDGNGGLIGRTDTGRWYSKVVVGSTTTQKQDGTFTYPDARFSNWKVEEYHVLGKCNTDNELELVTDYIVDSNVIQDLLQTPDDSYDDDIFLVEMEADIGVALRAIAYDDLGGVSRFYNKLLQNEFVILRYTEQLPNSIAQFITLQGNNDTFRAKLSADDDNGGSNYTAGVVVVFPDPYFFDDEVFDYNNRYNDSTYRYTVGSSGFFRFVVQMRIINILFEGPSAGDLSFTINLRKFDSGNVLLETQSENFVIENGTVAPGADRVVTFSTPGSYSLATDYFNVQLEAEQLGPGPEVITFDIGQQSYFECVFAFTGGGIVAKGDPETYRTRIFEYNYPMTIGQWETLVTERNGIVTFNESSEPDTDRTAFINRVAYNYARQTAEIELIS